ncbi:MAG: trypsin-like peptidase domain-containing protein [Clostridia bacterium]|nr:trypsin-like peptidase domain-containing protein [Clostridia bacterium]
MKKVNLKRFILILVLIFSLLVTTTIAGCAPLFYYGNLFDSNDTGDSGDSGDGSSDSNSSNIAEVRTLSESIQILEDNDITVNSVDNQDGPYTVAEVAQKVSDSIVNITVTTSGGVSAGSGVLFATDDEKYYVITNNHVIEGGTKVVCELTDRTQKTAAVVASDASTDIGIITITKTGIDGTKYKTVTIPNDEYQVRVGDTAIAIGNSLGELGGTVTSGIVSALDRQMTVEGNSMFLMQTDTAINQGNSGGGLFDAHAQLIGIVNAKIMSTGIEGLGFAIPVKVAVATACDLITKGYVSGRPAIGVMIRELNSKAKINEYLASLEGEELTAWSAYFNSTNKALGLYVAGVTNTASGLEVGDYVMSFGNRNVITQNELSAELAKKKIGDNVIITVKRNGQTKSLSVALIEKTAS